jgi:hypothetical protein
MRRRLLVACMVAMLGPLVACGSTEPGAVNLVFSWPGEAPDFAAQPLYVWGELQPGPDNRAPTQPGPDPGSYKVL